MSVTGVVSPCGSYHWQACFTADMLAENLPEAQTQIVETAGPPDVKGRKGKGRKEGKKGDAALWEGKRGQVSFMRFET